MFCSQCGNQIENGDSFCPNCGARVQRQAGQETVVGNGRKRTPLGFWVTAGVFLIAILAFGFLFTFGDGLFDVPRSSHKELTRQRASELLEEKVREAVLQQCAFVNSARDLGIIKLIDQPELRQLKDQPSCDIDILVMGIRKINETEAEVHHKFVVSVRKGFSEKASKALRQLHEGLANRVVSVELVSQQVDVLGKPRKPGPGAWNNSLRWKVTFPSGVVEGIECLPIAVTKWHVPGVIRWDEAGFPSSNDCQKARKDQVYFYTPTAKSLVRAINEFTKPQEPVEREAKSRFQLWDDGWRIIER